MKYHIPNCLSVIFSKNHAPIFQYMENAEKHSGHYAHIFVHKIGYFPGASIILSAYNMYVAQNDANPIYFSILC